MRLLVITPTYNEIDNIEPFIKAVFSNIPADAAILVVDDNSPDGTANLAEKISADYPDRLLILNRKEKEGLAAAYLAGFNHAWNGPWDVFIEIDADFSHKPEYIPVMLEEIKTHDVVIGSRNIKGGGVEGWSFFRNVISKGGSIYSRIILGCPIRDLTGGFNMWRKDALIKINLSSIISQGYSFQIELKYKAYRAGCSIKEIPIIFSDRKQGKSKMSKKIFLEALLNVIKIKTDNNPSLLEFFKFAVTGGLGTVTNLIIFFLCADLLGLNEIPVSIGCFLIAATQNYFINHFWSFKKTTASILPSFKKWALFICASLGGLLVNITVMKLMIIYLNLPYKFIAQACGILAGMMINFFISKYVVFKKKGQ
ncbi:MAG: glycosyltransferase family 2 protein [Treponema sp.]|nr:glycosyltransferase family 2 protein [Treponema sp.]